MAMTAGILLAQAPARATFGRNSENGQCMEELKLSDAQSKKIDAARSTFERQRNTSQAEIQNLRMDVKDAMMAENFKRVKELNQQITAKQLQMKNAHVDMMAAMMKELSKEQKVIMQSHMQMGRGHNQGNMRGNRAPHKMLRSRRGPNMGRYSDDVEHCDDYDGVRKFRNRP
jgi:hypothetical protein